MIQYPELLAPAGSPEAVRAAVICGADAVYIGGKRFSARANARNFDDEEFAEAVKYCHLYGVKVHRAINTLVFNNEYRDLAEAVEYTVKCGADAIIVQDIGAAALIKEIAPDMPVHASTQMTVHTIKGAEEAAKAGFSRVVLSRELPLDVISEIAAWGIETEVFVHGALCMSVSGQCLMSAFIGSRSANRGLCAACCRLPFTAGNKFDPDKYALSLKDLSYINRLDELKAAGVTSLKIEGRMKRAEYTAAAVTAFRAALDGKEADSDTLSAVFSRSGFTDGYLDGKTGKEMFGTRSGADAAESEKQFPYLHELYRAEKPVYSLKMSFCAEMGKNIRLEAECSDIKVAAEGGPPEKARSKGITAEYAEKQLSKLGGTAFYPGGFDCRADEGAAVSASALNALRREAVTKLEEAVRVRNTPCYNINKSYMLLPEGAAYGGDPEVRIHINKACQLETALKYGKYAVLPAEEALKCADAAESIFAALPPFTLNEKRDIETARQLRKLGINKLYCSNIAHIAIGNELGFEMSGSFRLNCANSRTAYELKKAGLTSLTVSLEAPLGSLPYINAQLPAGIVICGYAPLMLTRNCPIRAAQGCSKCSGMITDRTGRHFGVRCSYNKEYTEIFNCCKIYLGGRLKEIKGAAFYELLMGDASDEELARDAESCLSGKPPKGDFTAGLNFRGVT